VSPSTRKYSRPGCNLDKIYPLQIEDLDSNGTSKLTHSKMIGLVLNPGEAAKLAVALMNAVSMIDGNQPIDVMIRLKDRRVTVTVR